jgi:hypothetical protein
LGREVIGVIRIRDYSIFSKRGDKKVVNAALKEGFAKAGRYFHDNLRDKRFTEEHARKAGYAPRSGSKHAIGSKSFWLSYTGKKLKKKGHMRPLEFSGASRAAIKGYANISSTSKGGKVAYPGARAFNFKNPFSHPTMNLNLEFRGILADEAELLADVVDSSFESMVRAWHTGTADVEVQELLASAGF